MLYGILYRRQFPSAGLHKTKQVQSRCVCNGVVKQMQSRCNVDAMQIQMGFFSTLRMRGVYALF